MFGRREIQIVRPRCRFDKQFSLRSARNLFLCQVEPQITTELWSSRVGDVKSFQRDPIAHLGVATQLCGFAAVPHIAKQDGAREQ